MTPLLQLRLWLREATAPERAMAAVTCLVLAALVAWAVVPDTRSGAQSLAGADYGTQPGSVVPSGSGAGPGGVPAASGSPLSPGALPLSPGVGTPGAPATAPTLGPVVAPGQGTGPLPSSPARINPKLPPIKLGFTVLDFTGLQQAGLSNSAAFRGGRASPAPGSTGRGSAEEAPPK
jgi:hypothetical protein